MRKLRIVGVDAESSLVECEVPDSGEKFSLPLDDRFRAAARGEYLATGGADRAPVTGTLRPREIQDRIRHGASPEEVASDAGVPLSRIEGFAIPVLLERSSAADLARSAHPVLSDGPSLDTLSDKVDAALDHRGVDPDLVKWDAWRDRSGGWVVAISWPAGLSDDARATWSFEPDSHGGSARALNEEAERILDPSRATALRTVSSPPPQPSGPPPVRSVPPLAPAPAGRSGAPFDQFSASSDRSGAPADRSGTPADRFGAPFDRSDAPGRSPITAVPPAAPTERRDTDRRDTARYGTPAAVPPAPASSTPAAVPPAAVTPPGSPAERGQAERGPAERRDTEHRATDKPSTGTSDAADKPAKTTEPTADDTADEDFLQPTPTEPERKPSSRRHPTMPSWEDVLLGVRSKED